MRTAPSRPAALAPVLAIAIVSWTLATPDHVHLAGIEGRTHAVVHRHSLDDLGAGPAGGSITAHGSHTRALFLSTFYDGVSRFVHDAPALVASVVIITPLPALRERARRHDPRCPHGPPRTRWLTRGPPFPV